MPKNALEIAYNNLVMFYNKEYANKSYLDYKPSDLKKRQRLLLEEIINFLKGKNLAVIGNRDSRLHAEDRKDIKLEIEEIIRNHTNALRATISTFNDEIDSLIWALQEVSIEKDEVYSKTANLGGF